MAIKNTSFAKGEAVQKLIEVIARVNNKSVTDDAALQSAIDEVREMFKTDELTECTWSEFNAMRMSDEGIEPGHLYKVSNVITSDIVEIDTLYCIGDKDNAVAKYAYGIIGDASFIILTDFTLEFATIKKYIDSFGNVADFYLPSLLIPSDSICNNTIIRGAAEQFAIKLKNDVGAFKNNIIISPKSIYVSGTTIAENKISLNATVNIDASGAIQINEIGASATVDVTGAGTVGMNKFDAASNVNIACVSNADVTHNEFGPQCVVVGTSLQVFQMNKVGAGSTGIQFSIMAAGNEIADNCQNIKVALGTRNKFGVQCADISLNGTTYGCSGNEFANGCGAEGAITLADGCGGNSFGIQCCNCTLNTNVIGCEFEGFNSVVMAAGLQNYSVKRSVGYGNGPQNISLYKNYTDASFRINVSRDTKGNLIYWTDDEPLAAKTDEFIGTNTVTTVANIPVTKSTVLANLTAGGAVSFVAGLVAGREVFVVAKNASDAEIELTFPASANVESLKVAAGAKAEFSLVSLDGTYHIRVAEDIDIPEPDTFIGSNSVVSVENIPVTKSTVVATLPAYSDVPVPVSFAEGLPEGREVYVIAQNASTDPLTLSFTDANVESVVFAPGQRVEFSVINIAGTYYTRVGVDAAAGAADVEEISAEEVAAKFA